MAYFDTKSGSLEEAIRGAIRVKKEKLDPVGKEDGDIDNDGDEDETDKYLAKRRKAIGKAIKKDKKEGNAFGKALKDARENGDKTFVVSGKTYKVEDYKQHENYDVGTQENTKAKLDATPGQSSDDWQQQVETMQRKNASMREALAKVWGVNEGKNPFKTEGGHLPSEKKKKEENKTMTGKPMTKIAVDPDMKEVKIEKKKISERLGKNYKYNKNFLFDDKKDTPMSVFKTMGKRPGGADYNQIELADYLAQKSGKDFKDVYFDDIELVYVDKTVGTMKQPIAKLIDALKKAR